MFRLRARHGEDFPIDVLALILRLIFEHQVFFRREVTLGQYAHGSDIKHLRPAVGNPARGAAPIPPCPMKPFFRTPFARLCLAAAAGLWLSGTATLQAQSTSHHHKKPATHDKRRRHPAPLDARRRALPPTRPRRRRRHRMQTRFARKTAAGSAAVSTIDPAEIEGFDTQPEPIKKLLAAALDLTKKNLTYTYGSTDPASGGMDCSGTIYYLLRQAGFTDVPRRCQPAIRMGAPEIPFLRRAQQEAGQRRVARDASRRPAVLDRHLPRGPRPARHARHDLPWQTQEGRRTG